MTELKILIICDVDGTINAPNLCQYVNSDGNTEYLYKAYDGNMGLIKRLLSKMPNVELKFISNGVNGAKINQAFCKSNGFVFELCNSLIKRKEVINKWIQESDAEVVFVVSDICDEVLLIDFEVPKNIYFLTSVDNWNLFGRFVKYPKTIPNTVIWVTDFEQSVLLKITSMLYHKLSIDIFFELAFS